MKPHLFLSLLAAALVALVLPLASSAHLDAGGGLPIAPTATQEAGDDTEEAEDEDADDEEADDDELEQEGTIALGTDSVLVTDEEGGVTSCAVPTGLDLSAFAGQEVELECRLVNGVWTVARVKSEDGETEIRVPGVDHSGPGGGNSGPGGDDDSTDDDLDDNSGPGGGDDDDGLDDDSDDDSVDGDDDSLDDDDDHSGGGGDDDEDDDD